MDIKHKIREALTDANVKINWCDKKQIGKLKETDNLDYFTTLIDNSLSKINKNHTEEKGFYIIYCEEIENPLYIGLTYKQELGERPEQEQGHEIAYGCIIKDYHSKELFIKLGIITESDLKKDTLLLYEDIEKCLIFKNQPNCNSKNKSIYNRLRSISIENTGYETPLQKHSNCFKKNNIKNHPQINESGSK